MRDIPLKVYLLYKKLGKRQWYIKVFFDDDQAEGLASLSRIEVRHITKLC